MIAPLALNVSAGGPLDNYPKVELLRKDAKFAVLTSRPFCPTIFLAQRVLSMMIVTMSSRSRITLPAAACRDAEIKGLGRAAG
jgi:hypothetical protein